MNVKLITAAIAAMGLVACSPDITPQSSTTPSGSSASSAPAQSAAEQRVAEADKPAVPAAVQEEKKEGGVAPGQEAKKDEGEKKAE